MSQTTILLEEEPLSSVLCKWAGWMVLMVIFLMGLIYFSNYFARNQEWLANGYNTGHPVQDIKNNKWRWRFDQVDERKSPFGTIEDKRD
jgi:hypothetical protein